MSDLLPGLESAQHLHPITVHFPLAAWPFALLFMGLGLARGDESLRRAGRWLVHIGTLSGLVAAAFGLWAADQLGHDSPAHDAVHAHRNWMLAALAVGAVASGLAEWDRRVRSAASGRVAIAAIVITLAAMSFGADRGAYLVYGHGVGTQLHQHAASLGEDHERGEPSSHEH